MSFIAFGLVGIGGAVGSMGRYAVVEAMSRLNGSSFPYGTMAVNVFGSCLMGIWIACAFATEPEKTRNLHLLFAVGVLGGFTTFSTFTLDLFRLMEAELIKEALLYVLGSVLLSFFAFLGGLYIFKGIS